VYHLDGLEPETGVNVPFTPA